MVEDIDIKLVILGEGDVGKTSLVNKFLGNEIPDRYLPTIGYNINHKDYKLSNRKLRITIWDWGGQKAFNEFNPAVYNNVDGAFLVFDISRPEETIKNLKNDHIKHLEYYAEEEEEGILFLVGNKLDLILVNKDLEPVKSNLSEEDLIITMSALTGENVNECFELLIYRILKQTKRNEVAEEFIKFIGKKEEQLTNQLIDLATIDMLLLKEKVKPKTTKIPPQIDRTEVIQYHDIQKVLKKIEHDRNNIFKKFYSTLSELEESLKFLKKASKASIGESIDNFGEHLIDIREEIESDLKSLLDLEREENIIIDYLSEIAESKAEPVQVIIKTKPSKEIIEQAKIKKVEPEKGKIEEKITKKEVPVSITPSKIAVEKNYLGIREPKKEIAETKTTKKISKDKKDKLYSEIEKSQLIDVKSEEDLDIISKQIKSDLIVLSDEENLYLDYEEENPDKKAIWRGKETKGFLEWKKKHLGIISKDEKDKLYSEIAKSQIFEVKSGEDLDKISEKIKSDLILITDEDKLHLIYEEENLGKKAIWRGKETKGFLEWKKNYI